MHPLGFGQDSLVNIVMSNMFMAASKVQTLSYVMKKTERFYGNMAFQISEVKYRQKPLGIYLRQQHPTDGLEVLFPKSEGSKRAVINPNKFPWFNITAHPDGSIMRDEQHHSIKESGYDYFMDILSNLYNKYNTDGLIHFEKDTTWNKQECYILMFNNIHYTYTIDTTRKGENLVEFAKRNFIPEYSILELNKNIDDYYDITPGKILNIPNDYAKGMKLMIDKKRLLPLVIEVYDDKGIYEKYEYHNLIVNPSFEDEEFSMYYNDYGF